MCRFSCLIAAFLFAAVVCRGGTPADSIIGITSTNLPLVIIDTFGQEIPDEPKIAAFMKVIDNGAGARNSSLDTVSAFSGWIGIEIRGTTTQQFPKKQYAVETRTIAGEDSAVSLLGYPSESDWVLSAPYNDKSLMRDPLVYTLARGTGRYASRSRFCELILNGEYMGLYILLEKIKRDKGRVNISKTTPADTLGDALTGGYIVQLDRPLEEESGWWPSAFPPYPDAWQVVSYQNVYPKAEDIVPPQSDYLRRWFDAFEVMMSQPGHQDSVTGFPRYLDVDSFVDVVLFSELTKNVDAYRLSTYLFKDRDSKGGKLFAGPLWDFNSGFGNCDYYDASVIEGFQMTYLEADSMSHAAEDYLPPFWWHKLFMDPRFREKLKQRWFVLRESVLANARIMTLVDSLAAVLDESQARNFTRWPVLGEYVWPNAFVGQTYQEEIDYLKAWITGRLVWLDAAIGEFIETPAVVSTVPADGTTDVPTTTGTFSLTFDAPVDTSSFSRHSATGPSGGLWTNLDTLEAISFSEDHRTLVLSGKLSAEKTYCVILYYFRNESGYTLRAPYVLRFTTAASWPAVSVGGVVGGGTTGVSPAHAIVVLNNGPFNGKGGFRAAAVADGSGRFVVPYVPDGTFFPIAMRSIHDPSEIDPTAGDPVAQGAPIVVAGSDTAGLVLTLKIGPQMRYQEAVERLAWHLAVNPSQGILRRAAGAWIDTSGAALRWEFNFTGAVSESSFTAHVEEFGTQPDTMDSNTHQRLVAWKPLGALPASAAVDSFLARVERSGGYTYRPHPMTWDGFDASVQIGDLSRSEFGPLVSDSSRLYLGAMYRQSVEVENQWVTSKQMTVLGEYSTGSILRITGAGAEGPAEVPKTFALMQNFPNPFNPATRIDYQIAQSGLVQLSVYDVLGRMVANLVNEQEVPGSYSATFGGSHLASGVYIYRLTAGPFVATRKCLLIR